MRVKSSKRNQTLCPNLKPKIGLEFAFADMLGMACKVVRRVHAKLDIEDWFKKSKAVARH
jgi:hypothetical protein